MGDMWKGVKRMLGMSPPRHSPPPRRQVDDDEKAIRKRQADQMEREDAKRRVMALDLRVDVLTRRVDRHEQKPHA